MKFRYTIPALLLIVCFNCKSQTIQGSLVFQNDRTEFDFTFVVLGEARTECDSLGNFTVTSYTIDKVMDTLTAHPFPLYIKVKIFNIPKDADTVILTPIPLFEEMDSGIPIINFKTKRASRKYFKKLNQEREKHALDLKSEIESYRYLWNNEEYKLELLEKDGNRTILINLDNKEGL